MRRYARTEARAALSCVDALVRRAVAIVKRTPRGAFVSDTWAQLEIKGSTTTLFWPEAVGDHWDGDPSIESLSVSFPTDLLVLSDDDFAAWAADRETELARQKEEAAAAGVAAAAAKELAIYERLRRKYDPPLVPSVKPRL